MSSLLQQWKYMERAAENKKYIQIDNFVVIDNLQCHQLWQICQIGDLCFQWDGYKHVAAVSFIASHKRHDVVKLMEQGQISIYIGA